MAAEVTDPSRRVIEGRGEVRASTQQYFAFLDVPRGFYQEGDQIEIEVATRDVMDRPFSAAGTLRVDRVIYGAAPEDVVDAHLADLAVKTDAEGREFVRWTAKEAGYYRFQYEAADAWGQTVTGAVHTWVNGPDMTHRQMHWSGVQLIPEKRTYEEGETCRLLIVTNYPKATVLLTQEANREILARRGAPHYRQVPRGGGEDRSQPRAQLPLCHGDGARLERLPGLHRGVRTACEPLPERLRLGRAPPPTSRARRRPSA